MLKKRGFYGVAMYHPKNSNNWGSLLRSANLLEADFIATIGARYKPQSSDTLKTPKHIPVFHYDTFDQFRANLPLDCQLVGIELDNRAHDLRHFAHPERAVYLLGAEDNGLPQRVMDECHHLVKLEGRYSMNVSVAGSIVLYHRMAL